MNAVGRAPRHDGGRSSWRDGERGFALIAVLLVLGLLGIVGAEFAYSMRLEASAMRSWKDNLGAAHLAEAAVEQALREIAAEFAYVGMADDGILTFYDKNRAAFPRLARIRVPLGAGAFSYRITDEQSRINLNTAQAQPDRLEKLLQCMGVDKLARDHIIDAIRDWIDANEEHRGNGAESEDYYLKLPTPYRARNGPIESLDELLQIKGITPALFTGTDGRPGLADVLSVARPPGQVNVNTATPLVFCGMGVSDAVVSEITQGLRDGPTPQVPSRLGVGGFAATSNTFRIEAEGLIDGRRRAGVTAIVQKRGGAQGAAIATLEWSGIR